jgi:hypothetical protein
MMRITEWYLFSKESRASVGEAKNNALILEVEGWGRQIRDEVLVFDMYW